LKAGSKDSHKGFEGNSLTLHDKIFEECFGHLGCRTVFEGF